MTPAPALALMPLRTTLGCATMGELGGMRTLLPKAEMEAGDADTAAEDADDDDAAKGVCMGG